MVKRVYKKLNNIHMVGIGGTGMSGIAEVLLNMDYNISGTDIEESEVTQRLARFGAKISIGHSAEKVEWADVVVASEFENHVGGGVYSEVHYALINKIPVLCLRDGKLYPVIDAKEVNRQDQKVRFAKLLIQE